MKFTLIVICLVLLSFEIYSKTLTINVDTVYATGAVTVKAMSSLQREFDTITFSNGVSLPFFNQNAQLPLPPEPPPSLHGICVNSLPDLVSVGFKYSKLASWKQSSNSAISIEYYANGDTLWADADVLPDSFMHLDSLWAVGETGLAETGQGKWLYITSFDDTFFRSIAQRIENFNIIIYFKTKRNKMKLQVSDIYINSYPVSTYMFSTFTDSIRLRWAVDSLGNGQFKQFTPIKNRGPVPAKPAINKSHCLNSIESLQHANGEVALFTTVGKRVYTLQSANPARLPPGVFVYRIGKPGQAQSWGKVLVR